MLSVIYILVINVVSYAGSGCVHIKDTETLVDCFEAIPLRLWITLLQNAVGVGLLSCIKLDSSVVMLRVKMFA